MLWGSDRLFAKALTERIMADYEVNLSRVEFRKRKGSFHQKQSDGSSLIVYGTGSLDRARNQGFYEYKTIAQWIGYKQMSDKGKKGVWRLVCHEAAHAIQHQRGGRHYNSVHNECFIDCYQELMTLYPFEEVKGL